MERRLGARFDTWLLALATALVLLGASIAPLLTPTYVRLEQDRVGAGDLTGYGPAQLDAVAGALLGDLVLWLGDFDVAVDGAQVLNERERAHMRDVRGVFAGFWLLVAVAALGLVLAFRRAKSTEARFEVWRAIGRGARGLVIAVLVVGAFAILAYEAAFEVFHGLFFSAGSWTFDPRTDRLVQLFPPTFWSDTVLALGVIVLGAAILTAWRASRRTRPATAAPRLAASKAGP